MGIRLIFLILAIGAIWLILRFYWQKNQQLSKDKAPEKLTDEMVECCYCKVHIPKSEAVIVEEDWYCSQEHADKDR